MKAATKSKKAAAKVSEASNNGNGHFEHSYSQLPISQIAKYPVEVQKRIHEKEEAFEWIDYNEDDAGNQVIDDYTVKSFSEFKSGLRRLGLKLADSGFDISDGTLHPEGLSCPNCTQRTGFEPLLFEDELKDGDSCLNAECFQAKALVQLTRTRETIAATLPNPKKLPAEELVKKVPLVTDTWAGYNDGSVFAKGEKILEYQKFLDEPECKYASPALIVKGDRRGQQTYICNDGHCKVHNKKEKGSQPAGDNKWELQRREREFQREVANRVRGKIFLESLSYFDDRAFWADKELLYSLVAMLWKMRFGYVSEILAPLAASWGVVYPSSSDEKKIVKFARGLDESQISKLLFLFVHASEGYSNWDVADHAGVKEINDRYANLNYKLLDAEIRVELAPKEHKPAAKGYLKAVQSGEDLPVPHFFWEEKKEAADESDD